MLRMRLLCMLAALALGPALATQSFASEVVDPELMEYRLREDHIGAFRECVSRAEAAYAEGRSGDLHHWLLQAAWASHRAGDSDLALSLFEWVEDRLQGLNGRSNRLRAQCLLGIGVISRELQDDERAKQSLQAAEQLLDAAVADEVPILAAVLHARAIRQRSLDVELTIELYERALELRRQAFGYPSFDAARNAAWLSFFLYRAGHFEEGQRYAELADRELVAAGADGHSLRGTLLESRANAALMAQDWSRAQELLEQSAPYFANGRRRLFSGYSGRRIGYVAQDDLALCHYMQGNLEKSWYHLQRHRNGMGEEFTLLAQWEQLAPETSERRRVLRRRVFDLLENDLQKLGLGHLLELLSLRAELEDLERSFLTRFDRDPPSIAELQAALDPGTAYVSRASGIAGGWFGQSTERYVTWFFMLRDRGELMAFRHFEVTGVARTARDDDPYVLLARSLNAAFQWSSPVARDADLDAARRELGATIPPALDAALEGVHSVIAELSFLDPYLRFSLDSSGRSGMDRFALTMTYSARTYLDCLAAAEAGGEPGFILALGAPRFSDAQDGTEPAIRTTLRAGHSPLARDRNQLPLLPRSGEEAVAIGRLFPRADVLTDTRASEASLRALAREGRIGDYDVLHFATHTALNPAPERLGLFLSAPTVATGGDGILSLNDVRFGWELDADLVTMSGCQTTRSVGTYGTGEPVGVTQAILGAGARNVVGSLWPVDDEATSVLMQRFYRNLREGSDGAMPIATALQNAQLWLRDYEDADGNHPWAHPIYWAGFVVTGAGR